MKRGYCDNIEKRTVENDDFRRVLYTGHNLQLVLMTLPPGCDIGEEVHDDRDQFFRIEDGEGIISIDGVDHVVKDDDAVIVPQGARHNVRATEMTITGSNTTTTISGDDFRSWFGLRSTYIAIG